MLLANIYWNQFRIIVKTRVVYDKYLFDLQEYK